MASIVLTIPNSAFSPNTTILSAATNANNSAISTWAALFATGTGYVFTTPASNATAVNVNGVTSQSVDILDVNLVSAGTNVFKIDSIGQGVFTAGAAGSSPLTVTSVASASVATLTINMGSSQSKAGLLVNGAASITGNLAEFDLTGGGTVAMALTSAGVLNVGSQTVQSTTAGDGQFGSGNSAGRIYLGGATHAGALDYGVTTAQTFTMSAALALPSSAAAFLLGGSAAHFNAVTKSVFSAAGVATRAIGFGQAGSTNIVEIGSMGNAIGSSGKSGVVFEVDGNGTAVFGVDGSGNTGISGTTYATSSSLTTKTNVGPLNCDPVADLRATTIVSFQALAEIAACTEAKVPIPTRIGPIAENLPASMREGSGGFNLSAAIAVLLAAGKIIEARVTALEGKLPASAG